MSEWLAKHFDKVVRPYGRLIASHSRGGERNYFFDDNGVISLIPAELVDPKYAKSRFEPTENLPTSGIKISEIHEMPLFTM